MKILVPLNNREHINDYIEAGAGEFYIGFYDEKWEKHFGEYNDLNRMSGFKKEANPYTYEEVLEIIKDIRQRQKSIYITFNSSIYNKEQLDMLEDYMRGFKEAEVDGVIVSSPELVEKSVKVGLPTVVSTIGGVYNHDIALYYKDLGVSRIILPRDLSTDEIGQIIKQVPDMEYEIFMMRNGCRFSDANCLGFHRSEMSSVCSFVGSMSREVMLKEDKFQTRHDAEINDMIYTNSFHQNACGLCSLYRFIQMGIAAGKIVGRSDEWQYVCRDVELVAKNIEVAKNCSSEEEYLDKMIFPHNRAQMCKLGLSCYYPEIRFKE